MPTTDRDTDSIPAMLAELATQGYAERVFHHVETLAETFRVAGRIEYVGATLTVTITTERGTVTVAVEPHTVTVTATPAPGAWGQEGSATFAPPTRADVVAIAALAYARP